MIVSGVAKRDYIIINDAFENNLKHVNVRIPIDKLTCVTGVSGCGKSSLIYDTLYAESQRELLESMSGNMFGQKLMNKPHVGSIDNSTNHLARQLLSDLSNKYLGFDLINDFYEIENRITLGYGEIAEKQLTPNTQEKSFFQKFLFWK